MWAPHAWPGMVLRRAHPLLDNHRPLSAGGEDQVSAGAGWVPLSGSALLSSGQS